MLGILAAANLLSAMTGSGNSLPVIIKRSIPSSGEKITPVGLGTWRTFDASDSTALDPLKKVLQQLATTGSVVDSSPMYGRSEGVVGTLSSALSLNTKLFLATKVWTSGETEGIQQIEQSFTRFQRKQVDLLQIHNLLDWKTHIKTLQRLKEAKRIRYIGITHYLESAYDQLEQIMRSYPIDFLQVNYSVQSRASAKRLLPLAQEKGIAVIINRPFEEGALFATIQNKPLPEWAQDFGCVSWAQLFLKFILSHPAVTCVIPGTSNPLHMAENLGAAQGSMPDSSMQSELIKLLAS